MNEKLSKILTIVAGLIGFVAIYFLARIIMEGDDLITEDADLQASIVSPFISFAKLLLIVTSVVAVVFSIWNLIKHPDALKRTLIGLAVLGVFLVIAYATASDAAVMSMGKVLEDGEAGSVSKWVSTGINFSFYLGVIGFGFFVYDFGRSLIK